MPGSAAVSALAGRRPAGPAPQEPKDTILLRDRRILGTRAGAAAAGEAQAAAPYTGKATHTQGAVVGPALASRHSRGTVAAQVGRRALKGAAWGRWRIVRGPEAVEAQRRRSGLTILGRRSGLAELAEVLEAPHSAAADREGGRPALPLVLHFRSLDQSPAQGGGCRQYR